VRALYAGFRLQLRVVRSDADYVLPLATVPLFAVTFLAIFREAGRDDLTSYAVMAPVLIALWALALLDSGEIVEGDRWQGVLEPAVATPASFTVVVLGRVLAVTTIGLVSFAEVWLVARLLFGIAIEIEHPAIFLLTLAATAFAVSGTAVIMAALFVLSRTPRTFQNSLSFPFYVLGGVLVPVSYLPDWLEPVSRLIFLSWSADLLRDSLDEAPVDDVAARLGAVVLLGAVGFAVGYALLARILRRARSHGTLDLV
jgi:ABC-2 type transport system permease protein